MLMRIEKEIRRDALSARVDVIYGLTSGPETEKKFEFYERLLKRCNGNDEIW